MSGHQSQLPEGYPHTFDAGAIVVRRVSADGIQVDVLTIDGLIAWSIPAHNVKVGGSLTLTVPKPDGSPHGS